MSTNDIASLEKAVAADNKAQSKDEDEKQAAIDALEELELPIKERFEIALECFYV